MCAIAGEVNYKEKVSEKLLEKMNEALAPRGPDDEGVFLSENVGLAHRRLAVIDPENGKQPMTYKNFTLVYNGELYNTDEIREGLVLRGYEFFGHSDTEVVLKAFAEYGAGCCEMMNGIFAFAVWDSEKRELFLARDRIGVKPLFYAETGGGVVFASEIKALLLHPEIKPVVDFEGAAQIMLAGPAKFTGSAVFRDIKDLPAAHFAVLSRCGLKIGRYWRLRAAEHRECFTETALHTKELIFDAVKRQLVSDVPLCAFLSGGLDSSVISAIAAEEYKNRGRTLDTYSIDYKNNRENFRASAFQPDEDAPYVEQMAGFIGSRHHNVWLDTPALADALMDAACARDLPGMADVDSSLYLFCREIKKDFTVAVSGECADEIFGGYPWYHRKEVLYYDGFPWATSVPERGALMKKPMSGGEAEEFVRKAYNDCLKDVEYLDADNADDRRMREMFRLNLDYFMATLLDERVIKENSAGRV